MTQAQKLLRTMVNVNWFIFGFVFLSVGMFVLSGVAGWAWAGFVASFVFGMGCAGVLGAKTIVERESS